MSASLIAETSGAASSAIVSDEEHMLAIQKDIPFCKMPFRFDVDGLNNSINSCEHLFDSHKERTSAVGTPHADVRDIWVRYNAPENKGENFNDCHFPVWYPCVYELPESAAIALGIMAQVGGEHLSGVLITKIKKGGSVLRHIDKGWHASFYKKYFVAIKNRKGARLCFDAGYIEPDDGDVYCFDNSVDHWVENNSDEDRIAMIVCIRTAEQGLMQ